MGAEGFKVWRKHAPFSPAAHAWESAFWLKGDTTRASKAA